jgi:DNA-binding LytR/AlgR family response regulator
VTTAIIAEDEPLLRDELVQALGDLWPELDIVAAVGDGVSALRAIKMHRPDVAFLDINMPQLTGLEVANVIGAQTRVVFLTAYTEHAMAAFELGAVDYLAKPLQRGRLLTTIERLRAPSQAAQPAAVAAPAVAEPPKPLRWIQASVGNLVRLITVEEVFYFQADAKYTKVVTAQGEALIRRTIKDLAEALNPDEFIQISRSAIVNLRRVESLMRDDGFMELRLRGRDERLSVSSAFQPAFRQM